MDDGGQRLLDVIDDNHALESFLRENYHGVSGGPQNSEASTSVEGVAISSSAPSSGCGVVTSASTDHHGVENFVFDPEHGVSSAAVDPTADLSGLLQHAGPQDQFCGGVQHVGQSSASLLSLPSHDILASPGGSFLGSLNTSFNVSPSPGGLLLAQEGLNTPKSWTAAEDRGCIPGSSSHKSSTDVSNSSVSAETPNALQHFFASSVFSPQHSCNNINSTNNNGNSGLDTFLSSQQQQGFLQQQQQQMPPQGFNDPCLQSSRVNNVKVNSCATPGNAAQQQQRSVQQQSTVQGQAITGQGFVNNSGVNAFMNAQSGNCAQNGYISAQVQLIPSTVPSAANSVSHQQQQVVAGHQQQHPQNTSQQQFLAPSLAVNGSQLFSSGQIQLLSNSSNILSNAGASSSNLPGSGGTLLVAGSGSGMLSQSLLQLQPLLSGGQQQNTGQQQIVVPACSAQIKTPGSTLSRSNSSSSITSKSPANRLRSPGPTVATTTPPSSVTTHVLNNSMSGMLLQQLPGLGGMVLSTQGNIGGLKPLLPNGGQFIQLLPAGNTHSTPQTTALKLPSAVSNTVTQKLIQPKQPQLLPKPATLVCGTATAANLAATQQLPTAAAPLGKTLLAPNAAAVRAIVSSSPGSGNTSTIISSNCSMPQQQSTLVALPNSGQVLATGQHVSSAAMATSAVPQAATPTGPGLILNGSLLQSASGLQSFPTGLQAPLLLQHPSGMQLLVRPAGNTAPSPLLFNSTPQLLLNTAAQPATGGKGVAPAPQAIMIPSASGGPPTFVLPQTLTQPLTPGLSGHGIVGGAGTVNRAVGPNTTPIYRLVNQQTTLQLQQINTPTGPSFIAVPSNAAVNLPPGTVLAPGSQPTVRTLSAQTIQLADGQQLHVSGQPSTIQFASSLTSPTVIAPAPGAAVSGLALSSPALAQSASKATISLDTNKVQGVSTTSGGGMMNSTGATFQIVQSAQQNPASKTQEQKKKKAKKKKKESKEGKPSNPSINLNEILKETGIFNLFDESDFGSLGDEDIQFTSSTMFHDNTQLSTIPGVDTSVLSMSQPMDTSNLNASVGVETSSTSAMIVPTPSLGNVLVSAPAQGMTNSVAAGGVTNSSAPFIGNGSGLAAASTPTLLLSNSVNNVTATNFILGANGSTATIVAPITVPESSTNTTSLLSSSLCSASKVSTAHMVPSMSGIVGSGATGVLPPTLTSNKGATVLTSGSSNNMVATVDAQGKIILGPLSYIRPQLVHGSASLGTVASGSTVGPGSASLGTVAPGCASLGTVAPSSAQLIQTVNGLLVAVPALPANSELAQTPLPSTTTPGDSTELLNQLGLLRPSVSSTQTPLLSGNSLVLGNSGNQVLSVKPVASTPVPHLLHPLKSPTGDAGNDLTKVVKNTQLFKSIQSPDQKLLGSDGSVIIGCQSFKPTSTGYGINKSQIVPVSAIVAQSSTTQPILSTILSNRGAPSKGAVPYGSTASSRIASDIQPSKPKKNSRSKKNVSSAASCSEEGMVVISADGVFSTNSCAKLGLQRNNSSSKLATSLVQNEMLVPRTSTALSSNSKSSQFVTSYVVAGINGINSASAALQHATDSPSKQPVKLLPGVLEVAGPGAQPPADSTAATRAAVAIAAATGSKHTLKQVYLTQESQERLKKLLAEIQVLNNKREKTEADRAEHSALMVEYERIIAEGRPVILPANKTAPQTGTVNNNAAPVSPVIRYSHPVGPSHKIITFSSKSPKKHHKQESCRESRTILPQKLEEVCLRPADDGAGPHPRLTADTCLEEILAPGIRTCEQMTTASGLHISKCASPSIGSQQPGGPSVTLLTQPSAQSGVTFCGSFDKDIIVCESETVVSSSCSAVVSTPCGGDASARFMTPPPSNSPVVSSYCPVAGSSGPGSVNSITAIASPSLPPTPSSGGELGEPLGKTCTNDTPDLVTSAPLLRVCTGADLSMRTCVPQVSPITPPTNSPVPPLGGAGVPGVAYVEQGTPSAAVAHVPPHYHPIAASPVIVSSSPGAVATTTFASFPGIGLNGVRLAVSSTPSVSNMTTTEKPLLNAQFTQDKLFEHQLRTDQKGALQPDYRTPFKSPLDACKRLIRYHVYSDKGPSPEELQLKDAVFEVQCEALLKKKNQMVYKYQSLLLRESQRRHPSAEIVMLYRMFNQEEKLRNEREKALREAGRDTELRLRRPPSPKPIDAHSYPWEDNWHDDKVCVFSPPRLEEEPEKQDDEPFILDECIKTRDGSPSLCGRVSTATPSSGDEHSGAASREELHTPHLNVALNCDETSSSSLEGRRSSLKVPLNEWSYSERSKKTQKFQESLYDELLANTKGGDTKQDVKAVALQISPNKDEDDYDEEAFDEPALQIIDESEPEPELEPLTEERPGTAAEDDPSPDLSPERLRDERGFTQRDSIVYRRPSSCDSGDSRGSSSSPQLCVITNNTTSGRNSQQSEVKVGSKVDKLPLDERFNHLCKENARTDAKEEVVQLVGQASSSCHKIEKKRKFDEVKQMESPVRENKLMREAPPPADTESPLNHLMVRPPMTYPNFAEISDKKSSKSKSSKSKDSKKQKLKHKAEKKSAALVPPLIIRTDEKASGCLKLRIKKVGDEGLVEYRVENRPVRDTDTFAETENKESRVFKTKRHDDTAADERDRKKKRERSRNTARLSAESHYTSGLLQQRHYRGEEQQPLLSSDWFSGSMYTGQQLLREVVQQRAVQTAELEAAMRHYSAAASAVAAAAAVADRSQVLLPPASAGPYAPTLPSLATPHSFHPPPHSVYPSRSSTHSYF